jgi:hypothetical protein
MECWSGGARGCSGASRGRRANQVTADVSKRGLSLLGIDVIERMEVVLQDAHHFWLPC